MTNVRAQIPSVNVVGIILAAGRSRRMGAFKPLLPFGDSTVIDSCIFHLREGGVENLVVVIGHRGEELRKHFNNSQITLIENPDPEGEMSSSIACGVQAVAPAEGAFIITPADYPAVPPQVISLLLTEWRKGALLIKPTWQDLGGHPVLIDMSFRHQLVSLDSERGLKGLFEDHLDQVTRLPVGSNYIARDLDTWDDYATLHQEVFGEPAPSRLDV